MNEPRMRTATQAIEYIKRADPDTAFTLSALKRMMRKGEIPVVHVESKRLVNLNDVLTFLSGKNLNE